MDTEIDYKGVIETYSGLLFSLTNPNINDVRICDIVRSLSNTCRFAGQCKFYTVGQHTLNMYKVAKSRNMEKDFLRAVILHDSQEAYIGDITRPLKQQLGPVLWAIEKNIQQVIFRKYGVDWSLSVCPDMKVLDEEMLRCEARSLMISGGSGWHFEKSQDLIFVEIVKQKKKKVRRELSNAFAKLNMTDF